MKMQVKTQIRIDREGDNLICYDVPTIQLLMGTTSVVGNYQYYGVKKEKGMFIVPISKVKERIQVVQERLNRLFESLTIMENIIEEAEK